MRDYVAAMWRCRFFWLALVNLDLRMRYRGSVLGLGWSLAHPLAMTAILCGVFHGVFQADVGHYAPYLITGLACWHFIINVTLQGCTCFQQAEMFLRHYPAPLVLYPLRIVAVACVQCVLALSATVAVSWCLRGFGNVSVLWSLALALPLLILLGAGVAILVGTLNVFFSDVKHLCEVGLPFVFYLTPIIYEPRLLGDGRLARLVEFNPLVPVLRLFQQPIVEGRLPDLATYGAACATAFGVALTAGLLLFRWHRRLVLAL